MTKFVLVLEKSHFVRVFTRDLYIKVSSKFDIDQAFFIEAESYSVALQEAKNISDEYLAMRNGVVVIDINPQGYPISIDGEI